MKPLILSVLLSSCFVLCGCATGARLTPEQAQMLLDGFHKAGCGGHMGLHGGASTGQLGGQASIAVDVDANCPTVQPPPT